MITHGNKQISEIVYARKASEGGGAVRLTNIIRGAQVVFGGLKPSFAWLTKATRAAILAAFGQTDGYAVIGATNAYLNALAATDPTKATALAGFINEEPVISKFLVDYPTFGDWLLKYDMHKWKMPRLAIDANDEQDERKWLIRSENNYTDWYLLDNVLSQTNFEYVLGGITPTNNYVSKVGNTAYSNGTIVKFFVPTTMPTGYSEWFADGMTIYINGQKVINTTAYHNDRKDVTFDFSPYIKLNEMNYIILRWWGGGSHGFDFGFLG